MSSKNLGKALFISVIVGVIAMIVESSGYSQFAGLLYTIAGLGLYVFGIWAGFRLVRMKEPNKLEERG